MSSPYRKTLDPRPERRKLPTGIEEHIPAGTILATVLYRDWRPISGEILEELLDVEVVLSNYAGLTVSDGTRSIYLPAHTIVNAEVAA